MTGVQTCALPILFGGYDWYIQSGISRNYKKLPKKFRVRMASLFGKCRNAHLRRFFVSNARDVEDTYIGQAFIMSDEEASGYLSPSYDSKIKHQDVTAPYYEHVKGADDLTKKMYLDMNLWLPGDILLKADKMTMAHSLELRVPYLDKEVWNVAKTLTSSQKMKGRHTKIAFREAALSHIPEKWANRKKAGFMVPFRLWILQDKYQTKIKDAWHRDYTSEFFNVDALDALLERYIKEKNKKDARKIYTIYAFLLWYDEYFVKR